MADSMERELRNLNIIVNWEADMRSDDLAVRFGLTVSMINYIVKDWRYNHRTGIRPADVQRAQINNLPGMVRKASRDRDQLAAGKR